jgi:hypothetical protein
VPGLASTTAAGLARRVTPAQWQAVEQGVAAVTGRMLSLLPAKRSAALAGGPVTIDLDATDGEVYGARKRGVAWNHQGQRVGWPHVAAWAETETVLAADLGDGTDDPRATAPGMLRRALGCLPPRARAGRVAMRADAGYFAGQLARAAHDAHIGFAIGARRIAPLWWLLAGLAGDAWHDAIEMDNAQVAVPPPRTAATARPLPASPGPHPAAAPASTGLTRAPRAPAPRPCPRLTSPDPQRHPNREPGADPRAIRMPSTPNPGPSRSFTKPAALLAESGLIAVRSPLDEHSHAGGEPSDSGCQRAVSARCALSNHAATSAAGSEPPRGDRHEGTVTR